MSKSPRPKMISLKDMTWKLTDLTGGTGALFAANGKKTTNGKKAEEVFIL